MEEKNEIVEVKQDNIPAIVENKNEAIQKDKPHNNNFDMNPLLPTAGTLEITKEQEEILRAPINEKDILIRPDGLVYLSWLEYQRRLDKAFGAKWSLVPNGMPQYIKEQNLILWGFYLIVDGKFVDFAIGQQEFIPNNRTMTYGDAMEGAKSNALMRCCKRLGIGLELWDKEFVENWKAKWAYQTKDEKGKLIWKKRTTKENKKLPFEVTGKVSGIVKKTMPDKTEKYIVKIQGYELETDLETAKFIKERLDKEFTMRLDGNVIKEAIVALQEEQ